MEDYKKKYENALDNFKKIKAANKDNKELVDFINYEYPELKESNDERIRKEILEYFKQFDNMELRGAKISDWIAWLEKQEYKLSDKVEQEDVELTDFESALFSAFSDAWQEYLSGKEVNVAKWTREHSAKLLEVAREQKSAWSEEDEDIFNDIIMCLDGNFKSDKSMINWLKSLKERYTWKPSNEQIKGIKCAIKTLQHQLNVGDKRLNSLYDDLKQLR